MTERWNLSALGGLGLYTELDVQEFIRRLKEGEINKIPINDREKQIITVVKEQIDKLAGEKLT